MAPELNPVLVPELDPELELEAVVAGEPPEEEPEGERAPDPEFNPESWPDPELATVPAPVGAPTEADPPLEPGAAAEVDPPSAPLSDDHSGAGGIGCGLRSHPCGLARAASASPSATLGRRIGYLIMTSCLYSRRLIVIEKHLEICSETQYLGQRPPNAAHVPSNRRFRRQTGYEAYPQRL
jgi:hypothetical protein